MSIPVNGTHAKEVALHFLERTQEKYTPAMVKKTIGQVKTLMSYGYTRDEVIKTIDYLIDVKRVNMYSLGYVNSAINNVLEELKTLEYNKKAEEILQNIEYDSKEVTINEESAERNREKGERFGTNTGFGKKHNFDMLKGHGKD